ncbi:hypothetical protein [Kingella oralis]
MKKLNPLFLALLFPFLTSCYQPSTNDLPEIPFRQPLILEPNKAQDFYFDITKEETSVYKEYEIGVEIIFPEQMPYEKFNPIHDRIREKGLPFNISLWRVENGKNIPVPLTAFQKEMGASTPSVIRVINNEKKIYMGRSNYSHHVYIGGADLIAYHFDYADFTHREETGYYHVRITPQIRQSDFGEIQMYLCIDQKPESK